MRISATVQARMGSSRLPGKVLRPILGMPMLELQIERIRRSRLIDEVILATSTEAGDDPLAQLASRLSIPCFRGSEEDVLGRVAGALKAFSVDLHVEFMGDNPMPDPLLVDAVTGFALKNLDRYDYVTNGLTTTYPPGMEVFVYPARVLLETERLVADADRRSHAGWNITQYPDRFRLCNLEAPPWHRQPKFHLEVDTEEDFEVVSAVYEHFYPRRPGFGLGEIIDFLLDHPELARRNQTVPRRWKALRNEA
ncbi:MAG: glycosyltransferase family protein [Candidatus Omnitrophica bacterium]|nr:glycosyltransferase family protein [Candidatus Omnitrophota bacterium]